MIGTTKQDLSDRIIQRLSYSPRQQMPDLARGIERYTPQAWYKALRQLRQQGVVVRERGGYFSLSNAWISEMAWLTHRLQSVYVHPPSKNKPLLPIRSGERVVYRFNDALSMNAFWAHLLLKAAAEQPGKTMYAYNPHYWWYLAHGPVEQQYNRGMSRYRIKTLMVVGGNGFLDRWNAQYFPKDIAYWLSPKPLYPRQDRYFNLFGDYFIEVRLAADFASHIHDCFTKVTSFQDVTEPVLINELQRRSPCRIIVTKQSPKAKAFKNKIRHLF
jgi:hypothetical protein